MEPYSTGGVYVNYLQETPEEGQDGARSAYGMNVRRLAEIKKQYDPRNLFRPTQNVSPGA
jgi:FAD/FMN-containing dehydrogenase